MIQSQTAGQLELLSQLMDELEKTETWGTLDTRLMVASRDEPTELLKIN